MQKHLMYYEKRRNPNQRLQIFNSVMTARRSESVLMMGCYVFANTSLSKTFIVSTYGILALAYIAILVLTVQLFVCCSRRIVLLTIIIKTEWKSETLHNSSTRNGGVSSAFILGLLKVLFILFNQFCSQRTSYVGIVNPLFGLVVAVLLISSHVVVSYENGDIRLFKYPCAEKEVNFSVRPFVSIMLS
jgi:low temperature requirement protein LtrA